MEISLAKPPGVDCRPGQTGITAFSLAVLRAIGGSLFVKESLRIGLRV